MTNRQNPQEMRMKEVIRDVINGNGNAVVSGEVADKVLDQIWSLYESGEHWVEWWLKAYAREGIRRRVVREVKDSTGVVLISGAGKVVELPTHVSFVTKEEGRKVYQLRLWWELDWKSFMAVVAHRTQQRRILTNEVSAYREVLRLRDQFPESRTPGEACEMAGIDPKTFEFDEDLVS